MNLKTLIEDGYSIKKSALFLGRSIDDIKKEVEKNSYELKNEIFSEECIDRIIDLYCSGVSAKTLGKKYSIDKRRVQKWVASRGKLRSLEDSHRLTFFNENIMDIIDNPAKAYWLGFFYADAYNGDKVNTFNVTLKGSDFEHIKKIARFFNLPEEKAFRHTTKNGIDTANIKLYSKHLCNKMTALGCPRAKSLILKFPKWLSPNLYNHFIRGLFDGDGCLTIRKKQKEWKWSFASTKEVCNEICNIISKIGINKEPYYISKTNSNTYAVEITGNEQIKKMCDWMYDGSDKEIRLDRKYELYLELQNQQNNRKFITFTNRNQYNINKSVKLVENKIMNLNFINDVSAYCLLGPMSKDIKWYNDNIFHWRVNKKHHFVVNGDHQLTTNDVEYLKQFNELNFHYLSSTNRDMLRKSYNVSSSKLLSIILNINEINYSGKRNKTIRNYMNRYKNFHVTNVLKNIKDVDEMIERWSDTMAIKYFRDFSGKNRYFFNNYYHLLLSCNNVFVYDGSKLVSFGIASGYNNKYSYVIGKALAKDYPGLSEFTDMKLYELLFKNGSFNINMGQATAGLLFYKKKFPNSIEVSHYNGKIKF